MEFRPQDNDPGQPGELTFPAALTNEIAAFRDSPYFAFDNLITQAARFAYSDPILQDSLAHGITYSGSWHSPGRRTRADAPIFPLTQMGDLDIVLAEAAEAHPEQLRFHEVMARSDSPRAHRALIDFSLDFLPPAWQHEGRVFDSPGIEYKSRLIRVLFAYASPANNPFAVDTLLDIYTGIRPGGSLRQRVESIPPPLPLRTVSLERIKELQNEMLVNFIRSPYGCFDEMAWSTFEAEPVDDMRRIAMIDAVLHGPAQSADFLNKIIDRSFGSYDPDVVALLKRYKAFGWIEQDRNDYDVLARKLSQNIIEAELAKPDEENYYQSPDLWHTTPMLAFAIGQYPWGNLEGNNPALLEQDIAYLAGLVKEANAKAICSLAADHLRIAPYMISKLPESAGAHKPQLAKNVCMLLAQATLSKNPSDYGEMLRQKDISLMARLMVDCIEEFPEAAAKFTAEDSRSLLEGIAAFRAYVGSAYPQGLPPRSSSLSAGEDSHNRAIAASERLFTQLIDLLNTPTDAD